MTNGARDLPFVSVLVPMRNEEHYIGACLRSLVEQDYPHDRFEVLVIDGESTDSSREIAAGLAGRDGLQLRVIDNPERKTAHALNLALAEARGEVIVRVDAHCEVRPDFLSQNVAALAETGADAVGGPIDSVGEGLVGEAIALAMSSPVGVGNAAFRYSQEPQYTDTVAFAAYRRDVFDRIGGFTEDIDAGEDDEFNYRLNEAGGKIFLTPKIGSTYYTRPSLLALFKQYRSYGRAKVDVLRRHPEQARLRQFVPASFVGTVAGLAMLSWLLRPLRRPLRWALKLVLRMYALAMLAASLRIAAKKGWKYLPVLPLAFGCLHVAYGVGFLEKLVVRSFKKSNKTG